MHTGKEGNTIMETTHSHSHAPYLHHVLRSGSFDLTAMRSTSIGFYAPGHSISLGLLNTYFLNRVDQR